MRRDSPMNWESSITRRSEEHTSELQSRLHLVCRLLLEKKKNSTQLSLLMGNAPASLDKQTCIARAFRAYRSASLMLYQFITQNTIAPYLLIAVFVRNE